MWVLFGSPCPNFFINGSGIRLIFTQVTKSLVNSYSSNRTWDRKTTMFDKFRWKLHVDGRTTLFSQNNIFIISKTAFSREYLFDKLSIYRHLFHGFIEGDVDLNFAQHLLKLVELFFFQILLLRFLFKDWVRSIDIVKNNNVRLIENLFLGPPPWWVLVYKLVKSSTLNLIITLIIFFYLPLFSYPLQLLPSPQFLSSHH